MNFLNLLTKDELNFVRYQKYAKNEIIFNENEPCKALGILIEGEIMIASYSFMEREVVFNVLMQNQLFGNHLIFSTSPFYKGKVIAKKKSIVAYLSYFDLQNILQKNRVFLLAFLNYNSDISIQNRQEIELLSFQLAKDRLMYFLYANHGRYTYKSISSLAKRLHLTREVLSRTIHDLIQKKVLSMKEKTLTIL